MKPIIDYNKSGFLCDACRRRLAGCWSTGVSYFKGKSNQKRRCFQALAAFFHSIRVREASPARAGDLVQDFQRDLETPLDYAGILFGSGPNWLHGLSLTLTLQSGNKQKNRRKSKTPGALIYNVPGSRSGGIRTRGLLVPNQTRYQTALHLEAGADEGTRTPDLLITNRLLYQLSHIGTTSKWYYSSSFPACPALFFLFCSFRLFRLQKLSVA